MRENKRKKSATKTMDSKEKKLQNLEIDNKITKLTFGVQSDKCKIILSRCAGV